MARFCVEQARAEQRQKLCAKPVDVLIVGGGIVGAGVARDAAMRGLRVGLVEQHDLAFGTSSRSSRLLHGGLRYLAQGRVGLVREASREKRILHRIAPHLAEPLAFVFPTYRGTRWPRWQLRMGVKLYDLLCGGGNLGRSTGMGAASMAQLLPGLEPAGLTGGVRYFDALTNDARLVIDTLLSAARHGAAICNYTRLEEASPTADGWTCQIDDRIAEQTHEIAARTVVNATGPWSDQLPHSGVRLRLTKGVHLVVDRRRLPVPDAVVMTEDRRILFAIPWGERVVLGTTDTDFQDRVESVDTEPEDVDEILRVVNHTFPQAGLTPDDVISTWAGLRPLIASKRGGPSDISRAHHITMPQPGWIDVAGGKLTTYRLIAAQVVDRLADCLGEQPRMSRCRTAQEPLLPVEDGISHSGILPPGVNRETVQRCCRHEWAVHLDDVMVRRTSWQHYLTNPHDAAARVADWMAEMLGWSDSQKAAEIERLPTCRSPS